MEYAARRNQKGAFEGFYKLIMRRNSVYVTFIIAGAFFGERVRDQSLFGCVIAY
jgi:ubiquinol-cytochrome c reductase subunit 9